VIDGTGGREYRIAAINPKKFLPAFPITTIFEKLLLELVFMLNTGVEPKLIKARSLYPDTQILMENKLHVVDVTVLLNRSVPFKFYS